MPPPAHDEPQLAEGASSGQLFERRLFLVLESYFIKPGTAIVSGASWIGPEIECYVVWLSERGCTSDKTFTVLSVASGLGTHAARPYWRHVGPRSNPNSRG